MAVKGSRVRFVILTVFGIIAVAAIALIVRSGPAPIVADETPRFSITSEAARDAIAPRWDEPAASGGGTRCQEAGSQTIWRVCESAVGQLMTVSASAPVFIPANAQTLMTVLHAGDATLHAEWSTALSAATEIERCTTAGPLWRATVDGRVVVGSVGRCPLP